jgi:cell division protein FtsW
MMFVGRVKSKFLLTFLGMGILGVLLIMVIGFTAPKVFPRFATWVKRIENFKDKDSKENFQADQAKIAIATGGITGKGPGKSTQRNMLPHPYSDFIFAFIIEEYGFLGGFFVVFLYLIFLFRGVRIATRSKKNFGSLLAFGLCFSLVFQAFINMAVATNLFPVTGQPLPLVSMGGTSIWFTSIAMGIILSVSTETESDIANEKL